MVVEVITDKRWEERIFAHDLHRYLRAYDWSGGTAPAYVEVRLRDGRELWTGWVYPRPYDISRDARPVMGDGSTARPGVEILTPAQVEDEVLEAIERLVRGR